MTVRMGSEGDSRRKPLRAASSHSRSQSTKPSTTDSGTLPVRSAPRPVVADVMVTPWSLAVETPVLCAAIQVPPACGRPAELPAPASPPPSPPTKSPRLNPPSVQFRLSKSPMRSSRHRRRHRAHTFPQSPYPVGQFLELRRPDGEPWLAVVRLQKAQATYDGEIRPRRQRDAQGVFDDFFKHVGGRMAAGDLALINSSRLDMPYIRLAEEVMYVHRLDALLARVLSGTVASFQDYELFCFVGALRHWYGWNREQFGKDLWDEHRLRGSSKNFRNAVFGWHNRSFHDIPMEERASLFWPMPLDWNGFEANRVLAVPSPSVAHYAATTYLGTAEGSPARQVLDRIFMLEYICNFVLSHAQACRDGVYYTNYPDRRMSRTYKKSPRGTPGRLFQIPRRVVQQLAEVHPFFFLESSGIDPVRGFLALRRAQEYAWEDTKCAAVAYDFHTGEPLPLPREVFDNQTREGNHPGEMRPPPRDLRTYTYEACTPLLVVSQSSLRDAEQAWERFKTLSRGCSGDTGRVQLSRVITMVMNSEGYGIETNSLTSRRKSLVGDYLQWEAPSRRFDGSVERHLNDFAGVVSSLPSDPEDAGISSQPWGTCSHPEGIVLTPDSPRPVSGFSNEQDPPPPLERPDEEAVLEDEFYGPPPTWLPAHEGYEALESAFFRLQSAYRRAELTVPATVCDGLDLACAGARRLATLSSTVSAQEARIHNLTVARDSLRSDVTRMAEENTRLRHSGSSSTADAQRGLVASLTQERDAARASLSSAESERDAARAALAAMEAERDAALASVSAVTSERDASRADLSASQAALTRVRGDLVAARTGNSGAQALQAELDGVRAELTSAESDLASVRTELATARAARAAADRRATRVFSAVQSQLGELVTAMNEEVQAAADAVGEEARKAFAGEGSSNPNKRARGA